MNSNWSYGLETPKRGHDLFDLDLWPLILSVCMDIISVNVNISWKFQDDAMIRTLPKRCDRRTDRRAGGKKCFYSCLFAAKNNVMWPFVVRHIPLCRKIYFQTWGPFFLTKKSYNGIVLKYVPFFKFDLRVSRKIDNIKFSIALIFNKCANGITLFS